MIFSTLEHILAHISFSVVSIVITIHLITLLVDEIVGLYDSSQKGMITIFFCITGLLVTRWIYFGHLPLSNLYESLIFLSWTITAPSAIFTQGFATSGLLTEMHQSEILVHALQSHWLMMHVSMMVLGYAALLCGSLLSLALLVTKFRKLIRIFSIQYVSEKNNVLPNISFLSSRNLKAFNETGHMRHRVRAAWTLGVGPEAGFRNESSR
ncbi:hypothetical protein UlMin_014181 [Ulmus minor]